MFILCQTVKQFLISSVETAARLALHTSSALAGEKRVSSERIQRGGSMSIMITLPYCLKSHGGNMEADVGRSCAQGMGLCNSWGTLMLRCPQSYKGLLAANPFFPPDRDTIIIILDGKQIFSKVGRRCLYFYHPGFFFDRDFLNIAQSFSYKI